MSIKFKFHPAKAVEAAALLLKQHGKPMQYLGLLKMLYIADRVALAQMEQPITGDHYVSMAYGPVLSGVYALIEGRPVDDAFTLWSKFIAPYADNCVSLLDDPGDGELCEEEEEILQQVYDTFGHLDPYEVAEWTHDLPEWRDPKGSVEPIVVEEILKNLGKSDAEIVRIQTDVMRETYLDEILNHEVLNG
ncbi:Panacea domain-containing protein [Leptothoe spongobia]|uniref:SocA family protein n=1 Tax=Leptothoe spongobia TAU-MAC 1115 TaxID=1967444 RepID=A0A947DLA5_9CYAN|nr:Panacea domain-containing protein [Leptothoe spongobia]MBT9317879.1 SocA family protein [Leptothoe spongobia TAU-MAC 1115]